MVLKIFMYLVWYGTEELHVLSLVWYIRGTCTQYGTEEVHVLSIVWF